jgi:hypothetical protein
VKTGMEEVIPVSDSGSESGSDSVSIFDNHDEIMELLRDIWPQMKGANILWFQNDLFKRIRVLETRVEGIGTARGFLPDSFFELMTTESSSWCPDSNYEKIWEGLTAECNGPDDEEALDAFEDDVCGWVEDMIPADFNFFMAALDEGTLNAEWLGKAQLLLDKARNETIVVATETNVVEEHTVVEPVPEVAEPISEKPVYRPSNSLTRRRQIGLPLTPSRLRRKIRTTRRRK